MRPGNDPMLQPLMATLEHSHRDLVRRVVARAVELLEARGYPLSSLPTEEIRKLNSLAIAAFEQHPGTNADRGHRERFGSAI